MGQFVKFILGVVKFVIMPFRLWFLKENDGPQKNSSPQKVQKDAENQ